MHAKSLQPLRRGLPLRDRIHDRLRAAIISGELAAGSPVIEAELAPRLGASRTPVREALRRLEAEGLLEPRGLRGSVVREVKADEVECVFEIREALESLAARRAARSMRESELRKLEQHVAAMRDCIDDANEMERHDTAFHDIILANANGDRLKRMLTDLREELIAYRLLSLAGVQRRPAQAQPDRPARGAHRLPAVVARGRRAPPGNGRRVRRDRASDPRARRAGGRGAYRAAHRERARRGASPRGRRGRVMSGDDVVELVRLLEGSGVSVCVDGGWGVDALLGEQTRPHADLDIAVPHAHVPALRA